MRAPSIRDKRGSIWEIQKINWGAEPRPLVGAWETLKHASFLDGLPCRSWSL